ncbi:uncharacterized protein C9orf85 homolog isoform X2 [Tribolium madens]|uniref:uncharacterized protein C9orf85 homolog isoform X2 n=2 Tax=Tribolium madens TaxID=41895 RepID=UPI001CF736A1|nr:uncharacterized protein C9orf85 homolog isoform X2 [Tribolium madens]
MTILKKSESMSTQKGNTQRSRSQKHQNKTAFKNTLHDTSQRTKLINNVQISDVCVRCKEIIEWKIKYKKYKPLTQPRKCVRCEQKNVKKAYHVMCTDCGKKFGVCTKCCEAKEVITTKPDEKEQLKLDNEMKNLLQSLPERKRRTFLRYMSKKNEENSEKNDEEKKEDLKSKLNALKTDDDELNDLSDFDDFDSSDE